MFACLAMAQQPETPVPNAVPPLPPPGGPPQGPPQGPGQPNIPNRSALGPGQAGPRGEGQRPFRPFVEQVKQRLQGAKPLENMSEEERGRIRRAMEQVWNSEEVKAARDGAWEAAKKYREALRAAVLKADPEVRPLLERILIDGPDNLPRPEGNQRFAPGRGQGPGQGQLQPQGNFRPGGPRPEGEPGPGNGPQGPPQGLRPEGAPLQPNQLPPVPESGPKNPPGERRAEGPQGPGGGRPGMLTPEELAKLTEAQRNELREAMDKINSSPEVADARKAAESAPDENRREALRKLREIVRDKMIKEHPELAKAIAAVKNAAGPRGEGEGRTQRRPQAEEPPVPPAREGFPPGGQPRPGAPESTPPPSQ